LLSTWRTFPVPPQRPRRSPARAPPPAHSCRPDRWSSSTTACDERRPRAMTSFGR
jgi:hypothetical protein